MRPTLIALALLTACADPPATPAYQLAIGEACDSDAIQLCSRWWGGLCFEGVCRQWCGLAVPPPASQCAGGEREVRMPFDTNPDACICVPN
jgi:hypothetical protein